MPQTTADFSEDFATLVEQRLANTKTPTQFKNGLIDLMVAQYGTTVLSNTALAQKISDFVEQWRADRAMFRDFLTVPFNGGPNSDGNVVMTDGAGATFTTPGLSKLKVLMSKGDNAATDLSYFWNGNYSPAELLVAYQSTVDVTYDVSKSFASCGTAPTANVTITITKNDVAWGTIFFAAGSTTGVITIPTPTQAAGQKLKFLAPSPANAAFSNVNVSLAGAL